MTCMFSQLADGVEVERDAAIYWDIFFKSNREISQ